MFILSCPLSTGVLQGECSAALAAGANAMLSPKTAMKICQLQVQTNTDQKAHNATYRFQRVLMLLIADT